MICIDAFWGASINEPKINSKKTNKPKNNRACHSTGIHLNAVRREIPCYKFIMCLF